MSNEPTVIRSLLENRIDHSGLFPPTALSLEAVLEKTAHFPSTLKHPYMIGAELVIPFEDLSKIDDAALKGFGANTFRIAIVNSLPLVDENRGELHMRIEACLAFNRERARSRIVQRITSFESKLLGDAAHQIGGSLELLKAAVQVQSEESPLFFVEPILTGPHLRSVLSDVAAILEGLNLGNSHPLFGFKARTSGDLGINKEQLATVVELVSRAKLPLKVTGGLHYPLPNAEREHGFLTLCIAVVLARKFSLPTVDILAILSAEDISQILQPDELRWKELSISAAEVSEILQSPHFSMGCCNPSIQDGELTKIA